MSLIQIERIVSRLDGGIHQEKQYYICSLAPEDCSKIGHAFEGIGVLKIAYTGILV